MEKPRVVRVSRAVLELIKHPGLVQNGQTRCLWCFTPKVEPRKKCEVCGYFGNTRVAESEMLGRRVFVEEFEEV